ncbi:MAG: YlxR family protein [Bacilli bacterium]
MKQKIIPMRTCVVTRKKCPKVDLIRVVKDNLGNVFIDESGKANGRGAYLERSLQTIKKAQINKSLEKHLGCLIPDSVYEKLEKIVG